MNTILDLEKLSHRSRSRIKDLGEVFTPESYVEDMLDLLAKSKKGMWSDEELSFFEPCAGHGNIVTAIFKRRLDGLYKKAAAQGMCDAAYFAVANSINSIWAIDVDPKNIENCRSRVLAATFDFLKRKTDTSNISQIITAKADFFAHVLSAIKWHIEVNETLSALSDKSSAKSSSNLTKVGGRWFTQNGHQPLDFNLTWATFFKSCKTNKTIPMEYERSLRFVESISCGKLRGFDDFEFAKPFLIVEKNKQLKEREVNETLLAGA